MRKTPLNNDIVHLIMDRADRAVVYNMMLTCQHYNRVGARYLLKWTVGLHPDDARQIESFVGFMTTDCNRYRFLRSLAITLKTTEDRYRPSGPQLALLADFFTTLGERGTNFTSLVFEEAEQVLDGHPALGNAMSLLRTLTALEISHVGRRTAAMLRDLRSRLHDVTFTACDHDYDPAMPADDRNPMLLFQASQSTLLHICASNFESSFGGPRYSNVTSLTITLNTTLVTLHLVYAFPNLRVLEVWECSLSGFTDYIRCRDENLAAQRIYGSWASLDRFGGSASMLYVLGLTCPITTVNFGYDFDINAADPDMLRQMITDARPVHLSVHIAHGHELLNYDLVAMLSEPCMDPVRSLHLHVELGLHDLRCDLDLAAVLSAVEDIVQASSASIFGLAISWTDFNFYPVRKKFGVDEGYRFPIELQLLERDLVHFADGLLASTNNLRKVDIELSSHVPEECRQIRRRKDGADCYVDDSDEYASEVSTEEGDADVDQQDDD